MEIILFLQHLVLPENDKRNIENSLLERKHFKGHQVAEIQKGVAEKLCRSGNLCLALSTALTVEQN